MDDQNRLEGLGNSELLAGLSTLVRQSNELTAQVLAHLVELEERMLHLELGFASLFSYCVEALGMSEGAAGRRVAAARVCRRFPGAFEQIARGQLHLCVLCALAPHLTADNATELMDACRGKTRRQVEELLALRFPRPDVREQIRRLPTRTAAVAVAEQAPPVAQAVESLAPLAGGVETSSGQIFGQSSAISANPPSPPMGPVAAPAAQSGATASSDSRRRARELEPLSVDRFGVHFTADAELRDLIERAWALASHRLPNGDLASLMKLMAASFVQQEEKRRFGVGARRRRNTSRTKLESKTKPVLRTKTDATSPNQTVADPVVKPSQPSRVTPPGGAKPSHSSTRYLSADVRREVHERDGGRCVFVSASGRRCDARAFVQLDHVVPFARRGGSEVSNLRLLCRAHNRFHPFGCHEACHARQCFGALHLAAKIAIKRTHLWRLKLRGIGARDRFAQDFAREETDGDARIGPKRGAVCLRRTSRISGQVHIGGCRPQSVKHAAHCAPPHRGRPQLMVR